MLSGMLVAISILVLLLIYQKCYNALHPKYEISKSVDLLLKYGKDARWDCMSRFMDIIRKGLK